MAGKLDQRQKKGTADFPLLDIYPPPWCLLHPLHTPFILYYLFLKRDSMLCSNYNAFSPGQRLCAD
jgi:hypothetical protein